MYTFGTGETKEKSETKHQNNSEKEKRKKKMLLKRRGVHHLGGTGLAQNWKKGKTLALMPLIKTIYRREQKKKSLFLSFFFR